MSSRNHSISLRLKQRKAYPGTYCTTLNGQSVMLGYGDLKRRAYHEYMAATVSDKGDLTIVRDKFATLPLYYSLSEGELVVGNDYTEVLRLLPKITLSHERMLDIMSDRQMRRPLAHEINTLDEGEELHYSRGVLRIVRPPDRWWSVTKDVPPTDYRQFAKKLNEYFEFFISSRLQGQRCVFTFSGGMDSTTLPQYYALTRQKAPLCAVMLHEGEYGITQRQKIDAFIRATGANVLAFDVDRRRFPLSDLILQDTYQPFHLRLHNEIFEPYQAKIESLGTEVLVQGTGGDEMLSNTVTPEEFVEHGDLEKERRRKVELPPFLTPAFREAYINSTPQAPIRSLPRRPHSLANVQVANHIEIERDMWPVTPFAEPELIDWCQGLPIRFRANKNILRLYHKAHGFVDEIYNAQVNETFQYILTRCMQDGAYDSFIKRLADDSVIVKMGYVDIDTVLDIYKRIKEGHYPTIHRDVFALYKWFMVEINAQYSGFQGVS